MLLKSHIKLIKSLAQKKYREHNGLFVVEGRKSVEEFITSDYVLHHLYTTDLIFDVPKRKMTQVSEIDLKRISQLKHPHTALAVFEIPKERITIGKGLIVALDDVRDPGNLGTIIRLCDWFGVKDLVCSEETVDCYNPKVVQATMGSLTRVNIHYMGLESFLRETNSTRFGTFMEGSNIYNTKLPSSGILIMGNEANGISGEIEKLVDIKLSIPRFGNLQVTESLNVATATSICLSEFKRSTI